jgi:hypothetical protein
MPRMGYNVIGNSSDWEETMRQPDNDSEPIYAAFTMDCLPPLGHDDVPGPPDKEWAARAPRAFVDTLRGEGLGATLFVAPPAAERLGDAFQNATGEGCELALLCHPQLEGHQAWLGSYNFERQRSVISQSREAWEQHFGRRPRTFRPGFFSANDHTYHVLVMEGFTQGSCSVPARMDNDQCSMWFTGCPHAHHTDPLNRLPIGNMEFLEFPVCSDYASVSSLTTSTYTPQYLRIEDPNLHDFAEELIERHLENMDSSGVPLDVITLVTSNVVGWGGDDDPHVERLQNICALLRKIAEKRGRTVAWKSMDDLHELWDERIGSARRREMGPENGGEL